MIQSAVRFPQWLHEQLQKAGGARGMSEEIRRRLELTFAGEGAPTDEITNEVTAEIREIASDLSRYGSWHTDRDAFDVFKAAVIALLSNHQPRSEANPETTARLRAVYGEKTSEDIGLILAHAAIFAYRKERTGRAHPTGHNWFRGRGGEVDKPHGATDRVPHVCGSQSRARCP